MRLAKPPKDQAKQLVPSEQPRDNFIGNEIVSHDASLWSEKECVSRDSALTTLNMNRWRWDWMVQHSFRAVRRTTIIDQALP
jgi:hypothetical protein